MAVVVMGSFNDFRIAHWDHEPRIWSAGLQPGAMNVSLARRTWRSWSSALRFMENNYRGAMRATSLVVG